MELCRPTFVPVRDPEMGLEKIVKIVHARGGKSLTSFTKLLTPVQALKHKLTLITCLFLFSMQVARYDHNHEE